MAFGSWSSLSSTDMELITHNLQFAKSAVISNARQGGTLLQLIRKEISAEIGYTNGGTSYNMNC